MQLTVEQVDEMLHNYRENTARIALIDTEISSLRNLYADMEKTIVEDSVSTTSVLTGMPRGNKTSDPTGRVGIGVAAGDVPSHMRQIEDEIRVLSRERRELQTPVEKVDALLKALNEKQGFVLYRKAIDQMQWREIAYAYKKLFDIDYSRQGIKKIYKESMLRLYRVAGCPQIEK